MPRFKQRFSFVVPPKDNDLDVLDSLKICDTVLFLVSAVCGADDDSHIDNASQKLLTACLAQVRHYLFTIYTETHSKTLIF